MMRTVLQKNVPGWLSGMAALLLAQLLFGLFAFTKGPQVFAAYGQLGMAAFAFSSLLMAGAVYFGSELRLAAICAGLLQIGAVLQSIVSAESASRQARVICFSACAASFFLLLYLYVLRKRVGWRYLPLAAAGGTLFLYVLLLTVGSKINGTRAWLRLGGFSLQLTELVKPLAIVFYASLFTSERKEGRKYIYGLAFLLTNGLMLTIVNELGTLLVLILTHLALCFLLLQEKRYTLLNCGGIGALLVLGGALLLVILKYGQSEGNASGVMGEMLAIAQKLTSRVQIVANLDSLDPYGVAYQAIQAREAVLIGGPFGSSLPVYIPVAESDYAFVSLILNMGVVFGLLTVLLYVLFFAVGGKSLMNASAIPFERAAALGCVIQIFVQAVVMILGSTNFIPCTGLTVPFLSSGGTYTMILFIMIGFVLLVTGKNRRPQLKRRSQQWI